MRDALITVLIPTFNRRAWLETAVNSVLQEQRVPLVIHIFDNASTDDTDVYVLNLMASDERVKYRRNSKNIGAAGNFERAFESVSTKYFLPLADDDWLLPNFLFDALEIMEQDEDLGAAVFVTEQRDESGQLIMTYPSRDGFMSGRREPPEHVRDWMLRGHYAWSSILWKSETISFIGAPYLHVGLASDVDFQLQVFCKYPVFMVNRAAAVYTTHPQQNSRNFTILSITDWANLLQRLDKAVLATGCIANEDYPTLRRVMVDRYKGIWQIGAEGEFTQDQLVTFAVAAGFRLGDWDFAFSLISRLEISEINATSDAAGYSFCVPPDVSEDGIARMLPNKISTKSQLIASLIWMKQAYDTNQSLKKRLDIASAKIMLLEQDVIAQSKDAAAAIEQTSQERDKASEKIRNLEKEVEMQTARLAELQNSRFRKLGRYLGLTRRASFEQ